LGLLVVATACTSTTEQLAPVDLAAAREHLDRPLPGDPAMLYRLRVPSSGGLRLSILTEGEAGRLTVSEPFGSAVSLTAWDGEGPGSYFDLREGCRIEATDLTRALGIGAMPLPQAVRLLGGRLPATGDDVVTDRSDGRIVVAGRGWAAIVSVAADPWRVVRVEEVTENKKGWRFELGDHSASVPGSIRLRAPSGRWAELELVRLEWDTGRSLPELPDLAPCEMKP
jgi:hypothetical protein